MMHHTAIPLQAHGFVCGFLAGHCNSGHESDELAAAVSQPVLRRLCDIEHNARQCPHIEERRQEHQAAVAEQPKWAVRHGVDLICMDSAAERHTFDLDHAWHTPKSAT
jgi:hypothetical protein